jgi:hypothetical protein
VAVASGLGEEEEVFHERVVLSMALEQVDPYNTAKEGTMEVLGIGDDRTRGRPRSSTRLNGGNNWTQSWCRDVVRRGH